MSFNPASDCPNPLVENAATKLGLVEEDHSLPARARFGLQIHEDIEAACAHWTAFESVAVGGPYQRLDWVQAWHNAIGVKKGVRPVLAIASMSGTPVLALPLGLERHNGIALLTFLGQENANQNTGLWHPQQVSDMSPQVVPSILRAVCEAVGADLVHLTNIPSRWQGASLPLLTDDRRESPSPVFAGKIGLDFDTLFRETHSKAARKKLQRKQRALDEAGDYRIAELREPVEIERGLDAFLKQRALRALEAGVPNAFGTATHQEFLRRLLGLDTGAPAGKQAPLSIWSLESAGAIRATYLCLRNEDRLICYASSIAHDNMVAFSPGAVLLKGIVEALCEDPSVTTLDLGLGDEAYKHAWTAPQPLFDCYIAASLKGRAALALLQAKQGLKTRIRRSRHLWSLVRKLRQIRGRFRA